MFAVIFRAEIARLDEEYSLMAARMQKLALEEYGCLEFTAVTEGTSEIAISYWDSMDQIQAWKANAEHLLAQAKAARNGIAHTGCRWLMWFGNTALNGAANERFMMRLVRGILKTVLLTALSVATLTATAATSIWKVSSGENVLYVGGTLHVLRQSDYPLPVEFDRAYNNADRLYFETDLEQLHALRCYSECNRQCATLKGSVAWISVFQRLSISV